VSTSEFISLSIALVVIAGVTVVAARRLHRGEGRLRTLLRWIRDVYDALLGA
jgi:hypothetical protein